MLSIAIIGAGRMGAAHAQAYAGLPAVHVAAVFDPVAERAQALAASCGAQAYTSLSPILGNPDVRAVSVCSPTPQHYEHTVDALRAGKHVLCEKPMAWTADQAAAMLLTAATAGGQLVVGHVLRFWPEYVAVRQLVLSGALGQPLSVYAARLNPRAWWTYQNWMANPSQSGGAVLDLLVHDADFCNWLLGKPERIVGARGVKSERGAWDHVQALLDYPGAAATLEVSYAMPEGYPSTFLLRVACERGAVEYRRLAESTAPLGALAENALTVFLPGASPEKLPVRQSDPYAEEIAHFVHCVQEDRPSDVIAPAGGYEALAVALAVRDTLDRGQPAEFDWQARERER